LIWFKNAFKLISSKTFLKDLHTFDKDNIKEEIFLETFEFLNRDELDVEKIKLVNKALSNIVEWTRSIISYHILVHPYKVRNV
jgi:hypothetical protein